MSITENKKMKLSGTRLPRGQLSLVFGFPGHEIQHHELMCYEAMLYHLYLCPICDIYAPNFQLKAPDS